MKKPLTCTSLLFAASLALSGLSSVVFAEVADNKITELEAREAYEKASENFGATLKTAQQETISYEDGQEFTGLSGEGMSEHVFGDVALVSDAAIESIINEPDSGYSPISTLRLTVNAENETLAVIVRNILKQAEPKAGVWSVKWRLNEDHQFLLSERVNLTAETTFEQFMDYLTDRINNMTGINLYVSVFEASRIIVISDTYY